MFEKRRLAFLRSKIIVSNSIHYDKHLSMENFLSANLSLTLFLPNITDSRIELIAGRSVAVLNLLQNIYSRLFYFTLQSLSFVCLFLKSKHYGNALILLFYFLLYSPHIPSDKNL